MYNRNDTAKQSYNVNIGSYDNEQTDNANSLMTGVNRIMIGTNRIIQRKSRIMIGINCVMKIPNRRSRTKVSY